MASVNRVTILGNLGRDPEQRFMPSGDAITNIAVATSYKPKDKEPVTEWHRIVLFGRLAEIVGQYCKKGSPIYVEGRLQTRKYTDKDGIERYATEIVAEQMQLLGERQGGVQQEQPQSQQQPSQREQARNRQHAAANGRPAPNFSDMDSEIPF